MFLQSTEIINAPFNLIEKITDLAWNYGPKLIGAIIVYLVGSIIIGWISKGFTSLLNKRKVDPSLQSFLSSFVSIILKIMLLLTVFGMIGVDLMAFSAVLAGLAVGVGAALNGTLGNFAGGVMMLLFKPFKLGDLISAQDQIGNVIDQGIFHTTLKTADNKTVIIANGPLSTGTIVNYTTDGNLRVDTKMAIYSDVDIDFARKVATEALLNMPEVKRNPAPLVKVSSVGDGCVTLAIMPFCDEKDYWTVFHGSQEAVKNAFAANKIETPIPHRVLIQK